MKAILSDQGVVLELSSSPETQFHPAIAAAFVTVPANTKVGQIKKGNKFVEQEIIPSVEPDVAIIPPIED